MRFVLPIITFVSCLTIKPSFSQNEVQKFSSEITASALKDNLSILASDALEGRLTGSRGQKMAAAFIGHHFQNIGLAGPVNGSYLQEFNLYAAQQGAASLAIGDVTFKNYEDIVLYNLWNDSLQTEVVAVNDMKADFTKLGLAGKAVLINWQGFSLHESHPLIERLKKAGARLILFYPKSSLSEFQSMASGVKDFQSNPEYTLQKPIVGTNEVGLVLVNQNVVEKILGPKKRPSKKSATIQAKAKVIMKVVQTENVLGYMAGTDKKNEVVVITAHYDHVGTRTEGSDQVYNGADDDGSGTTAVMQIAQAFAEAKKQGHGPRRSILFMTVSAEEWGLYGSEYYVDHPVFSLSQTVTNLNIDMIGRSDEEHKDKPDYVYVIGADKLSSQLHEINERNNTNYTKLDFDYTYNDEHHPTNLYQRSDHWNFAKNRVPIIFYFDGIHEDYHQVSDEVHKIDFDLLAKRTQCVFYTAWEIANREERLIIDK
jgi:hypothetical protein